MYSPTSTNTYSTQEVASTNNQSNSTNQQHIIHQTNHHYLQAAGTAPNASTAMYNQQLMGGYSNAMPSAYMQPINQYSMHGGGASVHSTHHHSGHLTSATIDPLINPIDLIYSNGSTGTVSNLGHHHLKCNLKLFFFLFTFSKG